jgi:hypothetical protein
VLNFCVKMTFHANEPHSTRVEGLVNSEYPNFAVSFKKYTNTVAADDVFFSQPIDSCMVD